MVTALLIAGGTASALVLAGLVASAVLRRRGPRWPRPPEIRPALFRRGVQPPSPDPVRQRARS